MKESEIEERRRPPETAYQSGRQVLRVPSPALAITLKIFQSAAPYECCCFWYGVRDVADIEAEVRAVIVPRQRQARRNYLVPVDSVRDVQQRVAPLSVVNLAQVHSHPGADTEHSIYDDEMANSRRALSIVIPHYGHWQSDWPIGIGVHEFQRGYWHRLDDRTAGHRVAVADGPEVTFLDCR